MDAVDARGAEMSDVPIEVTRDLWDRKAAYWDARFGEGNDFHRTLIEPYTLRLLNLQPDQHVLDIATGNGAFARVLAERGLRVTAFDFSPAFIERARARSDAQADRIDFRVLDATDERALLSLGERAFDAAVSNMALMDMPAIEPLARALARLLAPEAPFVFSVQHPCFNSNGSLFNASESLETGRFSVTTNMLVTDYLLVPPGIGPGMPGEPNGHYYFHRPLTELFRPFFAAGFFLDALEEPTFLPGGHPLTWDSVGGRIPPALISRMRLRA